MKRHFLIIVEGPHDASIIGNYIQYKKYAKRTDKRSEVSEVWRGIIPKTYPFSANRYDRVSPVPDFYESEELSIAIKTAGGDSLFPIVLKSLLGVMGYEEQEKMERILIVSDADNKTAAEKKKAIIKKIQSTDALEFDGKMLNLKNAPVQIPVIMYCFPNDEKSGNLENLLLEIGDVKFPELVGLASEYIDAAVKSRYHELDINDEPKKKKAIVGCITNTLKPGKANQNSLMDNEWITEETLEKVHGLRKMEDMIERLLK